MALNLSGIVAQYAGAENERVLHGVDLEVPDRGCLAVVGPSGSGKSTLGRVMNGLLKPLAGSVKLDGAEIHQHGTPARIRTSTRADSSMRQTFQSLAEVRRRVALLMQQPDNQLFGLTVGEDIRFGPQQAGFDENECQQRMEQAMERVGMDRTTFVSRSPFSLSGGERRRVALAGLLAMQPQHLVLDEPVAGLDPAGREGVENVIRQTSQELSVVLLTADLPLALRMADRLVLLTSGKIVFDGTPADAIADRERIALLRLVMPVEVDVLLALRQRGAPITTPSNLRPATVISTIVAALNQASVGRAIHGDTSC